MDSLTRALAASRQAPQRQIEIHLALFEASNQDAAAINHLDQALALAARIGDTSQLVSVGRLRGFALMDLARNTEAINQMKKTLFIAKRKNMGPQVRSLLNSLGIAFADVGSYDSALTYHFESLGLREKEGDKMATSVSLNNIGLVYYKLQDHQQALRYYHAALALKQEINDQSGFVRLLVNIGLCYSLLKDHQAAEDYAQRAVNACGQECKTQPIVSAYVLLARTYLETNNLVKSEVFTDKALELASQLSDQIGQLEALMIKSNLFFRKKNFQASIDYALRITADAKNKFFPEIYIRALEQLIQSYDSIGDVAQVRQYQSRYIKLKDSVYSYRLISNLAKIQAQYEERSNLKTIQEQDQILQLKEEIIRRQFQQSVFTTIIACLGLALAYLLFRLLREIQRKRTALSVKNRLLQEAQEALRKITHDLDQLVEERTRDLAETNRSLTFTNEELDHFIYRTSHDIRGPLASLLGLAYLGKLEVTEPVASNYLHQIDITASKLNAVLSKLAKINQISRGELKPVQVDIPVLLNRIIVRLTADLPPEKVDVSISMEHEVRLISDVSLIETCLENLISNAIKYRAETGRARSFVNIQVEEKMHAVLIRVIDNGIGIPEMPQEQLFRMFVRASERSETGGIGLYLAKLSATRIFGKLSYAKNELGYTVFTLLLHPNLEQRLAQSEQIQTEKRKQEQAVRARVQALSNEAL